jgi:hypothetical protein
MQTERLSPKDTDKDGQPTIRFSRNDPPKEFLANAPTPIKSDEQTIPMMRAVRDEDKRSPKLSPHSSQRTEPAKVVLPDRIEQALRQSDPVPRHLKEAADPDRTLKVSPPTDHTERFERKESRRGLLLAIAAVAIFCGLVFILRQASNSDNPPTNPTPTPGETETKGGTATSPEGTPKVIEPAKPIAEELPTKTPEKPATTQPAVATSGPKPATTQPAVATSSPKPATTQPAVVTPKPTTPQTATPKPAVQTSGKKLVVTEIPKTFDEQMELAQRLVEREQFDEAQRLFETILGYASHVPAVHVGLGKCALETGRTTEAIQHYQNALTRLPTYGPAIFGLAKAYRQKGDKEQAINWYKKYLELNPTGSAATVARDALAKLEGQPPPPPPQPPSELVKPSTGQPQGQSELIKPQ